MHVGSSTIYVAKTKALISCAITKIVQSLYLPNFKPLVIFCDGTAWFVSDLFGNPKDRFSSDAANFIKLFLVKITETSPYKSDPKFAPNIL